MSNGYQQNNWQQGQNNQYRQQYGNQQFQQPHYQPGGYQPFNPQPVDDYQPIPAGQYVSKGEYRRKYTPKSFRKQIRTTCIFSYVLIAINLLLAFLNPWSLIGVVVQLGLTLGIHLAKSKGCAIAMIVYGALNILAALLQGSFSGWAWLAIGIGVVVTINKVDKHYKEVIAGSMTGMYR